MNPAAYTLHKHASLAAHNTLRVDACARQLAVLHDAGALAEVLERLETPPLVLGQGSNVLFAGNHPGSVLVMATQGVQVEEDDQAVRLAVAAGERWDDFVRWTLAQGWPGLENLILIPGTVGAAPIQNIGAYGVEVARYVESVETWDTREQRVVTMDAAACRFGYRDSRFKQELDRYVVTAVRFILPREHRFQLEYAGLREELARSGIARPTPYLVADAVRNLRTRKLPDPAVIGNAGSFFKNPVVPASMADTLLRTHPQLAHWPLPEGQVKLSAAWLIDTCGFKGLREGDAGISNRHALVLVNHGQASGEQLWALARKVMDGVQGRFGIQLEPEPRILGI